MFWKDQKQGIYEDHQKGDHQQAKQRGDSKKEGGLNLWKGKDTAQVGIVVKNILKRKPQGGYKDRIETYIFLYSVSCYTK